MPTFLSTPVAITVSGLPATTWTSVDISSIVPAGTTAVMCSVRNGTGWTEYVLARATGETYNFAFSIYDGGGIHDYTQSQTIAQVSASRTIDIYVGVPSTASFIIYGYFTNKELAIQTPFSVVNLSTFGASGASWNTVDLSSYVSAYCGGKKAYGVIVLPMDNSYYGGSLMGIRPTGNTLNIYESAANSMKGWMAAPFTPGNGYKVDLYSTYVGSPFMIIGFLLQDSLVIYNSSIPLNVTTTAVFQDVSTLPVGALAGLYTVTPSISVPSHAFAPSGGSAIDIYAGSYNGYLVGAVPCGSNQKVSIKCANTTQIFNEVGYWRTPPSAGQLFFGANY